MAAFIFINEDHTVRWTGASGVNSTTGVEAYLNTATVTYALKDYAGATVSGGTGTLSYIAASNGDYIGTIESTVASSANLTEGALYTVEYTLVQGSYNGFRRERVRAAYRT